MVERKVRGSNLLRFLTVVVGFRKGRPERDVTNVEYGGKDVTVLVCNAHTCKTTAHVLSLLAHFGQQVRRFASAQLAAHCST